MNQLPANRLLIGIDEVGRGAWAGPVVAAAVVLPEGYMQAGLRDSKLMTAAARQKSSAAVQADALGHGVGWVTAAEVDEYGLSWAVRQSGLRALEELLAKWPGGHFYPAPMVILDGSHNYLSNSPYDSLAIVKADGSVLCVSAASVVAKVARDTYMEKLDEQHPGYGFGTHKGYGTVAHRAAISRQGVSAAHRLSYAPIRTYLEQAPS